MTSTDQPTGELCGLARATLRRLSPWSSSDDQDVEDDLPDDQVRLDEVAPDSAEDQDERDLRERLPDVSLGLRSRLRAVRRTAREWVEYLTPWSDQDVEQDVDVDLSLLYRAHRAICAREGLSTTERPASIHATEDVARYADLDDLVGKHRAFIDPASTQPERVARRLRDLLLFRTTTRREVSLSEAEVEALVEWQVEQDVDAVEAAPFDTVEESIDQVAEEIVVDPLVEPVSRRTDP